MNMTHTLAFTVYPYIALTVFAGGHLYRYLTDMLAWNAHSSEFLEKKQHFPSLTLFHWGILLTLLGHAGGLLIPQSLFDVVGFDARAHMVVAYVTGILVGNAAFIGSLWLIGRRIAFARLRATTTTNDWGTLAAIAAVSGAGLFNVLFGHFNVLDTVAPWIRGIVTFRPNAELMATVPLSYKVHIILALSLLGFSPFSRLVHIWSAPVFYVLRVPVLFRKRVSEEAAGRAGGTTRIRPFRRTREVWDG